MVNQILSRFYNPYIFSKLVPLIAKRHDSRSNGALEYRQVG